MFPIALHRVRPHARARLWYTNTSTSAALGSVVCMYVCMRWWLCLCVLSFQSCCGIVIIAAVDVDVAASASPFSPPLLLTYLPCTFARHEAGPGQETIQVVCVYILCFVVFPAFLFRCFLLLLFHLFTLAHMYIQTDTYTDVTFGNIQYVPMYIHTYVCMYYVHMYACWYFGVCVCVFI